MELEQRPLGNTDICISKLGYGCASVWGKQMISDEQAKKLFEKAYGLGIRYFDTGHSYGMAEQRIGKILKSSYIRREDLVLSTKFGTRMIRGRLVHDASPQWMRKSVELSLKRMYTDYIDCLQIHGPQISDFTSELYDAFEDLKEKGMIRAAGANSFDTDVLEFICRERKLDFVMLDYNIMKRSREKLIKKLYKNGIGVIAGAPLAESLYSRRIFRIRDKKDLWYLARALKNFRKEAVLGRQYRFINDVPGITGSQAALKYVLDNPMIAAAVFGTVSMKHLEENVKAADLVIPGKVLEKIKQQDSM